MNTFRDFQQNHQWYQNTKVLLKNHFLHSQERQFIRFWVIEDLNRLKINFNLEKDFSLAQLVVITTKYIFSYKLVYCVPRAQKWVFL